MNGFRPRRFCSVCGRVFRSRGEGVRPIGNKVRSSTDGPARMGREGLAWRGLNGVAVFPAVTPAILLAARTRG